jgi:hypothetical protein
MGEISAVVQTGSMIFRSECMIARKTVWDRRGDAAASPTMASSGTKKRRM